MLAAIERTFAQIGSAPGHRLAQLGELGPFLREGGAIHALAARHLDDKARPVRCIAFDKHGDQNWTLGWHQDRTICVRERAEVAGFGPWTCKQGLPHVEPPFGFIERMITARIHLDPVDAQNAPLKIALGSHRCGLIGENLIATQVESADQHECLAQAGDVWLYATPILHASAPASPGRRRRVLQVDFSSDQLPHPLDWLLE